MNSVFDHLRSFEERLAALHEFSYAEYYDGKMPITIDNKKFYFEGATKKVPRSKSQADAAANNSYVKGEKSPI